MPQDLLRHARGLGLRHRGDRIRICRIGQEQLRIELGFEPGTMHVRTAFDQVVAHDQETSVAFVKGFAAGNPPGNTVQLHLRSRRLPDGTAIELARLEVGGHDLDVLVQVLVRRDPGLFEDHPKEAVCAGAVRRSGHFAVEPLHGRFGIGELRRVVAHENDIALLLRRAQHRNHANVGNFGLGGRNDCRHVAHVADLLLVGEQLADDDRAL